jgi:hypothetical protein
VNAAYTSQVDSMLQADGNAARNIEARLDDADLSRYISSVEVRKVLIKLTVA